MSPAKQGVKSLVRNSIFIQMSLAPRRSDEWDFRGEPLCSTAEHCSQFSWFSTCSGVLFTIRASFPPGSFVEPIPLAARTDVNWFKSVLPADLVCAEQLEVAERLLRAFHCGRVIWSTSLIRLMFTHPVETETFHFFLPLARGVRGSASFVCAIQSAGLLANALSRVRARVESSLFPVGLL